MEAFGYQMTPGIVEVRPTITVPRDRIVTFDICANGMWCIGAERGPRYFSDRSTATMYVRESSIGMSREQAKRLCEEQEGTEAMVHVRNYVVHEAHMLARVEPEGSA